MLRGREKLKITLFVSLFQNSELLSLAFNLNIGKIVLRVTEEKWFDYQMFYKKNKRLFDNLVPFVKVVAEVVFFQNDITHEELKRLIKKLRLCKVRFKGF